MRVIPCYDLILLPGVTFYFQAEYFRGIAGRKAQLGEELLLQILKHEDKKKNQLTAEDFYPYAVTATVVDIDKDGNVGVNIHNRVQLLDTKVREGDIYSITEDAPPVEDLSAQQQEKHLNSMRSHLLHFIKDFPWGPIAQAFINKWGTMEEIVSKLGHQMNLTVEEKYNLLAAESLSERTTLMEDRLYEWLEGIKLMSEAEEEQDEERKAAYREAAIRRQMDHLQSELNEMHPETESSDLDLFRKKIEESGMNDTARREAEKVLKRMIQEGERSHEYGMLYDYLDFVTGLNWRKEEFVPIDLKAAEEILESDHYGQKKAKERILQQLAVMALNRKQAGSILLFVGSPGTGKTSMGESIARALGRKYCRISLGGVRDEAEIRGHRRTYIGALPGRIMDGIRRSGASNPVVVLDEVDKLARDMSGDPGSALLEVLDPEQNSNFTDHYMNVPYDLSDVLFICTANSMDTIPGPLLNRMEVIQFEGYTPSEKLEIAKRHLLPKAKKSAGIRAAALKVPDDTLRAVISDYTAEAGVRGLKKQLDSLCRSAAVRLVKGEAKSMTVSPKVLDKYLSRKPILHDKIPAEQKPGIVTGLAYTQAGGDVLFIETLLIPGSGKVVITGQLGDVMKESAQLAVSLVKSLFPEKAETFEKNDLHIHVPAGAIPKDGPSAGITLTTALCSLLTGQAVAPTFAMTGEISLRGGVMPIGGLPEKLSAAVRAGVKTVFIPADNVRDLDDVAEEIRGQLQIIPVKEADEVLKAVGILQ